MHRNQGYLSEIRLGSLKHFRELPVDIDDLAFDVGDHHGNIAVVESALDSRRADPLIGERAKRFGQITDFIDAFRSRNTLRPAGIRSATAAVMVLSGRVTARLTSVPTSPHKAAKNKAVTRKRLRRSSWAHQVQQH